MNAIEQYVYDRDEQVKKNITDRDLRMATYHYTEHLVRTNYTKNFTWMGVPVIQYPGDLMVIQELIWKIKPHVIIECGVAFGGLTLFMASLLKMQPIPGMVMAIDIEIRQHTKDAIRNSGLKKYVQLCEWDSLLINKDNFFPCPSPIVVVLDSNHTHNHVLQELKLYSPLVSVGSYLIVFDTAIEDFGHLDRNQDRPWGKGNNPATAVREFMAGEEGEGFVVDREVEQRAGITAAIGGWLKRIK